MQSSSPVQPHDTSGFQIVNSRIAYQNRWMTVREDQIIRPDGSPGLYGVVEKPDFAIIAAVQDGLIHLVEQYRYPVQGRYWEMPQGSWEFGVIDALDLARQELREETGLIASSIVHVSHVFHGYGYSTQGCHIFFATGLTQGETSKEATESDLVCRAFALPAFEHMLLSGVIKDASTVAAYGMLKLRGLLEPG